MIERRECSYQGQLMAKGREVELCVIKWLEDCGNTVVDATKNLYMQRQDVDVVVKSPSGEVFLCEIKADYKMSQTKNFVFETTRIYHATAYFTLGWAIKTPAEYLLYVTPDNGNLYKFKMSILRQSCSDYLLNAGVNAKSIIVETDKEKTTQNILVPLTSLKYELFNLNKIPN